MKRAYHSKYTGPDGLVVGDLPPPTPSRGEVMVRVRATAIYSNGIRVVPIEID